MLKALPGVERVRAKANNQHIDVLFDPSKQNITTMTDHLSTAGYQTKAIT